MGCVCIGLWAWDTGGERVSGVQREGVAGNVQRRSVLHPATQRKAKSRGLSSPAAHFL